MKQSCYSCTQNVHLNNLCPKSRLICSPWATVQIFLAHYMWRKYNSTIPFLFSSTVGTCHIASQTRYIYIFNCIRGSQKCHAKNNQDNDKLDEERGDVG